MNVIFKKLNFKNHQRIAILNAPAEFQPAMQEMQSLTQIDQEIDPNHHYEFVLIFVQSKTEVQDAVAKVHNHLAEDPLLWMAYPKKSSKKYEATINRDAGWEAVGKLGYEGVRQIAIDDDWSALRFRDVDFIKTMKRHSSLTMSKKGKERVK